MAKVTSAQATTVRLDPAVKARLERLGALTHLSLNRLVNDAVSAFIDIRFAQIEGELEATLQDLRTYRNSDPGIGRPVAEAARAEAAAATGRGRARSSGR